MKKLIKICAVVAVMSVAAVNATAAVTLDFTEVDVGASSKVDLTNQFAAYGVTFDHVYRYIDPVDPWHETDPYGHGYGSSYGWGISNGWQSDGGQNAESGTVIFTNPTPYVTIDWVDLGSNQIHVWAYDSGNSLLDSFIGPATSSNDSGTTTLSGGLISYMTFNDDGGNVAIANMTYAPIPAPGALLLGSMGMGIVGWSKSKSLPSMVTAMGPVTILSLMGR